MLNFREAVGLGQELTWLKFDRLRVEIGFARGLKAFIHRFF